MCVWPASSIINKYNICDFKNYNNKKKPYSNSQYLTTSVYFFNNDSVFFSL